MGLFFVMAAIYIASIVLFIYFDGKNKYTISSIFITPIVIGTIYVFASLIICFILYGTMKTDNIRLKNDKTKIEVRINALKEETPEGELSRIYLTEAGYQTYKDAIDWNTEYETYEMHRNNPWIGMYFPDIYQGMSEIDLTWCEG